MSVIEPKIEDDVERIQVDAVNSKENRALYEARKKIHPKRASGTFRNFKWFVMFITLGIYYITPWLRWDRGPGLPDQAVLLDLAHRRFYFFFIEIWPHEFFYVAGLLVMAGVALFLVTSVLGRAWCGYTCPQTVWVDLFLVVERFFEGERNARIKLDAAPMSGGKLFKRSAKHVAWLLISIATGGAWIFYFADAPTLLVDLFTGQAAFVAYATVGVLTATTYVFGGFMREQVCTYMCPWPRIQAAMMDENSLTVTYNDWRGEPRSRHAKRMRKEGVSTGDCVDCNACVAVCPMGIDIRDGQQLECITCALCIDACDSVMNKIGLEKGLIAYATSNDYYSNMELATAQPAQATVTSPSIASEIIPTNIRSAAGELSDKIKQTSWKITLSTRNLIYFLIYAAIGLGMAYSISMRDRLALNVIHDRNPIFTVLSDGSIRNGYEVRILNMKGHEQQFLVTVEGLPNPDIQEAGFNTIPKKWIITEAAADSLKSVRLFISTPKETLKSERTEFRINVSTHGGTELISETVNFEAPKELFQ
jgi:cytochrome c oxidase accessory protein FixG